MAWRGVGAALLVLGVLVGCNLPSPPAQVSAAPCDAGACGGGEIRVCSSLCITPRTSGQSCDVTPDCTGTPQICAANLVCVPGGGGGTCTDLSSRYLSLCGASADGGSCPSGTTCINLRTFSPNLTRDVHICSARLAEGQRCEFGATTVACELGFVCTAGFCRRPCASGSDCACADNGCGTLSGSDAGVCTRCWSATGLDPNRIPLRCGVNSACCNGLTCNPDGSGNCCHTVSTSCADGAGCCTGSECVHTGGSTWTCTACGGLNATCSSGSDCCGLGLGPLTCQGPMGSSRCCPSGFSVCSGGTGSCEDVRTNAARCGTSCTACQTRTNTVGPHCRGGECVPFCQAGYGNCDGVESNGCETNIWTSTSNCGACGRQCPSVTNGGVTCTNGICDTTCDTGYTNCSGLCVNLNSDLNNCNACGLTCPGTCSGGVCTESTVKCDTIPPGATLIVGCTLGDCCRRQTNYPSSSPTYNYYTCYTVNHPGSAYNGQTVCGTLTLNPMQ